MKLVATSFLVGATVIFFATHAFEGAWVGYVRAAAEAGMVGALADWFAVTALFRRPLGLPIPHTAIIPDPQGHDRQTPRRLRRRRTSCPSEVVRTSCGGRASPSAARRVDRAAGQRRTGHRRAGERRQGRDHGPARRRRPGRAGAGDRQAGRRRSRGVRRWASCSARCSTDGAHHKLVDLMCDRAYEWVRDNHDKVSLIVTDRAPTWSPKFVDSLLGDKVYAELLSTSPGRSRPTPTTRCASPSTSS